LPGDTGKRKPARPPAVSLGGYYWVGSKCCFVGRYAISEFSKNGRKEFRENQFFHCQEIPAMKNRLTASRKKMAEGLQEFCHGVLS
jgi:hypothetical protein